MTDHGTTYEERAQIAENRLAEAKKDIDTLLALCSTLYDYMQIARRHIVDNTGNPYKVVELTDMALKAARDRSDEFAVTLTAAGPMCRKCGRGVGVWLAPDESPCFCTDRREARK